VSNHSVGVGARCRSQWTRSHGVHRTADANPQLGLRRFLAVGPTTIYTDRADDVCCRG